jgi:hypothetical protein
MRDDVSQATFRTYGCLTPTLSGRALRRIRLADGVVLSHSPKTEIGPEADAYRIWGVSRVDRARSL